MAFLGGDTQQMRDCADRLSHGSGQLAALQTQLTDSVRFATTAMWEGPDAQAFSSEAKRTIAELTAASERAAAFSAELREQASEQDEASEVPPVGMLFSYASNVVGALAAGVAKNAEVRRRGRASPRDVRGKHKAEVGSERWKSARKGADADSGHAKPKHVDRGSAWSKAAKWAGRASTATSALLTAINTWNEDPSLSTGERVKNTAIMTTTTTAGSAIGSAIGGSLGSRLGMVAGPGGSFIGAALGSVLGSILGGLIGEQLGEWLKNLKHR